MKQCRRCKQDLPFAFFPPKRGRNHASSYCRSCARQFCREYYQKNADIVAVRRRANMARYTERNRALIVLHLSARACLDCGETDPRVLEFDHVRGEKLGNISSLVTHGYKLQRLEVELAKCEVRCANCHRRKTAEQFGWRVSGGM